MQSELLIIYLLNPLNELLLLLLIRAYFFQIMPRFFIIGHVNVTYNNCLWSLEFIAF